MVKWMKKWSYQHRYAILEFRSRVARRRRGLARSRSRDSTPARVGCLSGQSRGHCMRLHLFLDAPMRVTDIFERVSGCCGGGGAVGCCIGGGSCLGPGTG